MKKSLFVLVVVLVLLFMLPLTASATKPEKIKGFFYIDPEQPLDADPYEYCVFTSALEGEWWEWTWDGFIMGCVTQPVSPGLAQHGIWEGQVGDREGYCYYNIRTYDIDGIARFSMNQCHGELEGLHMKAVGWGVGPKAGTWEGTYHFHPNK